MGCRPGPDLPESNEFALWRGDTTPHAGGHFLMLSVFATSAGSLKKLETLDLAALPEDAVWLDLNSPVPGEDKAVDKLVGIEIPTREDMHEIEISSRLYVENGSRYMTATLMC